MSSSGYTRVPRDEVGLSDVQLDSADLRDTAADADGDQPQRQLLTKRTVYSPHRVEERTPRRAGESDSDYKRRVQVAHINSLLHSVAWVAAALGVLYFTDLWNVVRYDQRVNHLFLILALSSGFVLTLVIAYLAVWVPLTATRPVQDLGAYAPTAAPIGAVAGVATFVFSVIALWPIWGVITLPILIVLSMAACLGPNLMPV